MLSDDDDASAIFVSFWSSLSSSLSSSAKVTYGMGLRAMLVRSLRRRLVDAAMIECCFWCRIEMIASLAVTRMIFQASRGGGGSDVANDFNSINVNDRRQKCRTFFFFMIGFTIRQDLGGKKMTRLNLMTRGKYFAGDGVIYNIILHTDLATWQ